MKRCIEIPVTAKFTWRSTLKYYLNAVPYVGTCVLNAMKRVKQHCLRIPNRAAKVASLVRCGLGLYPADYLF